MGNRLLGFFDYGHLPPALGAVSQPCAELANLMDQALVEGPEKDAGLRKLLEAKDCFIRAHLEEMIKEDAAQNAIDPSMISEVEAELEAALEECTHGIGFDEDCEECDLDETAEDGAPARGPGDRPEFDPDWTCKKCGCTYGTPCAMKNGEPCSWAAPDLCSACEEKGGEF